MLTSSITSCDCSSSVKCSDLQGAQIISLYNSAVTLSWCAHWVLMEDRLNFNNPLMLPCGKVSAAYEIFKCKKKLSEHRIWIKAYLLLSQTLIKCHKTWLVHLFHKNPSITNTTHHLLPSTKTPRFLAYTLFPPRFVLGQGHKCSSYSLWQVDCGQQLSTPTAAHSPTFPPGWWKEMEEQTQEELVSKDKLTCEETRRKNPQAMYRQSLTTSHRQISVQPVSKPWLLWKESSQIYCWACYIVYDIIFVSLGQLLQLCPLPISCRPQPTCWWCRVRNRENLDAV